MARFTRLVVALALALPLLARPAAADDGADAPAWALHNVENNARRQEILHRSWPTDGVPGTVLVTAATAASAREIAAREGGDVIGARHVLLHVPPGTEGRTAARVVARGGVVGVDPDRVREVAATPDDPGYVDQWPHRLVNAEAAWNTTVGDPAITVAVLDTGVDGTHPDLVDNLVEQVDVSSGTVRIRSSFGDNDACDIGHGTFVAGVVGAAGSNGVGVTGVAWDVGIVDVALTSRSSRCGILDSAIIAALDHVTNGRDDAVDIVNLSLGALSTSCPTALQAALDDARDAGTLVVAASGNEQGLVEDPIAMPASCDGVLSVGAVGAEGDIAPYSNANEHVDVAAPGGDRSSVSGLGVVSTTIGGGYGELEGTSFAAPYVAGVAALLRSIEPTLSPDDLEAILELTATDRGEPGRDIHYGWGLVNVAAAVEVTTAGATGPPAEDPGFPVRGNGSAVERVDGPGTTTTPVLQAAAMSQYAFEDGQALHAVVAREDDFADALAGSALGFGLGPLLFTSSTGPLAGATREELQRVLEPGATVYLLGGTAALPAGIEDTIAALGFVPERIAGVDRMQTSVMVAEELEQLFLANEFQPPGAAMVATAYNWPDAVSAGAMGAWFGLPILVTPPTELDDDVEAFLADRSLDAVYVVGGTAALRESVRTAVSDATGLASGDVVRLAGVDRSATTVAVSAEFERVYSAVFEAVFGIPAVPPFVAAVNLRRQDGFAHVLSASGLTGRFGGVFGPVEGEAGDEITEDAQSYLCRFPATGIVVGGEDVIHDDTSMLFDQLIRGSAEACTS